MRRVLATIVGSILLAMLAPTVAIAATPTIGQRATDGSAMQYQTPSSRPYHFSASFPQTQSWSASIAPACATSAPIRSFSGSGTSMAVAWNGKTTSGAWAPPGIYEITVTSSTAQPWTFSLEITPALGAPLGACPIARLAWSGASDVSDGVRRVLPARQTLVVVSRRMSDRADQMMSGPLAASVGGLVDSTDPVTLSPSLAARIHRDHVTKVYLLGRGGSFGGGIFSALRQAGITYLQLVHGTDAASTAAAATATMRSAGAVSRTAIVAPLAPPTVATLASGVAYALKLPVLGVTANDVPAATSNAIKTYGLTKVFVFGTTSTVSDAVVTKLKALGVTIEDVRGAYADTTEVNLIKATGVAVRDAVVVASADDGLESVLSSPAGPTLYAGVYSLGANSAAWASAHKATTARFLFAAPTWQLSPWLMAQTWKLTETPATPPASFVIHGSGFGHGAGMSQYGAYAMGLAGKTGRQIVGYYYTGTSIGTVDDARLLRVNLLHGVGAVSVTVGPASSTTTGTPIGQVTLGTWSMRFVGNNVIRIRPYGSTGYAVDLNGTTKATSASQTPRITWSGTRAMPATGTYGNAVIKVTGGGKSAKPYRWGELDASRYGSGLNVVNVLQLGPEYMREIGEVPYSWGVNGQGALEAQALAARTYAWVQGVKSVCACQVYDSTLSQVFAGWDAESRAHADKWLAAVSTTAGQVVTYAGNPITAYYYSASGGRTMNSEDVWSTALPYIRSVADPYSLQSSVNGYPVGNPNVSWTVGASQASMASVFGLDNVATVAVASWTAGHSPASLVATSNTGAKASVTGKAFVSHFGLKAPWVTSVTAG